jgi:hypothetical protein
MEDLNDLRLGRKFPEKELATKWIERNDARAYALVGDPAACIRAADLRS